MTPPDHQVEILRQLRAARDDRFLCNEHGRYYIPGEPRPDRKVREKLLYSDRIIWTFKPKGMVLTEKGRRELEHLEALVASNEEGA